MADDTLNLFVVSDGTGATAAALVKAGLVHFRQDGHLSEEVHVTRYSNTRTQRAVDRVLDKAKEQDAFVVHTFGSPTLRKSFEKGARKRKVETADVIGPLIERFSKFLHQRPASKSGLLHQVDEAYYRRIDAVEFAIMHDDSKALEGLPFADIVLVGVSRTGKTPLSVYLALEGWRVANVALVPDRPVPPELEEVEKQRIVGLVIEPARLLDIRKSRLRGLGSSPSKYDDVELIEEEVKWSKRLFRKHGWAVLDTTMKSIEESANAVLDRVVGPDRRMRGI